MADYYTLLTDAGIAYETACKAAGTPIKLSQISVGDGGGTEYNPAATATALKREVWRGPLNALFQDENNPSWLLAEVTIPSDVGGWYVREAGIWTDTGTLYAIVKYPESFKPVLATSGSGKEFYIRSIFETSNAELVTLLIDDTVVKATRAWVTGYVADELAKLDRKQSVRVATTANIVLSGAQAIDGVAVIAGNRVLVKSQTLAKDNGIYVAANGAWVRAKDADASAEVTSGLIVSVEEGATLANTIWQLITDGVIVLGTTGLAFQNITQGFAPLNSPALLGVPTAPTATVSTNNQQLATTAFVQRALGNHTSVGGLAASTVLTAAAFGQTFIINSVNSINITLPLASTGFNGGTITFTNVSTGSATLILQGTDYVAGMAANQLVLKTMDSITLSTGAGITWYAENGSIRDVLSTAFKDLMAGKLSLGQLGLGVTTAPALPTFKAITPTGLYKAYGTTVPNEATPEAPPESGNKLIGVLAITPRIDATYYLAFEHGAVSRDRRIWVGQYSEYGNNPATLFWSRLSTVEEFETSVGASGYQHYPGGLIRQWGVFNAVSAIAGNAYTTLTITLPKAFPNGLLSGSGTVHSQGLSNAQPRPNGTSKSSIVICVNNNSTVSLSNTVGSWEYWGY
ncbi:phage tail protein [Pseudomonas sp. ABY48]|uniref:phage tail protein n=1 Tax=Pseudomonas sp. ABY48 TaxID=3402865 RepID=UPI003B43A576